MGADNRNRQVDVSLADDGTLGELHRCARNVPASGEGSVDDSPYDTIGRTGSTSLQESVASLDIQGQTAGESTGTLFTEASAAFGTAECIDGSTSSGDGAVVHPAADGLLRAGHQYTIERPLASGGMGDVFLARQEGLNRTVALKRPRERVLRSGRHLDEFVRESVVTGALEHPNIVPVYQNGIDRDGTPFYSMKLIRGIEWRDLLRPSRAGDSAAGRRAESMTLESHLDILVRVCDAIAFAHSRNVIHRDLKPQNVIVGEYGEIQVTDWGLALDIGDGHPQTGATPRARTTGIAGTPAYMAPEMARADSAALGPATDVYLLGAILYEILTGHAPHAAEDRLQSIMLATGNTLVAPVEGTGSFADELAAIARRALATDPRDRYASVLEFQSALREYLSHAQSLDICERSDADLRTLRSASTGHVESFRSHRYVRYAQIIAAYRQALALWSQNARAERGLRRALESFSGEALDGGDLGLARSHIDELSALVGEQNVRQLRESLDRLEAHRRARARRTRVVTRIAAVLLAGLVAGAVAAFIRIRNERNRAEEQRTRAEAGYRLAESRRVEAERNQQIAEARRRETEEARVRAQEHLELAERRRVEAEQRRREAIDGLARIDLQRAAACIEASRDFQDAALHTLDALRILEDLDTSGPRLLLAHYFRCSPVVERRIALRSPPLAVASTGDAGMFRTFLIDGTLLDHDVARRITTCPHPVAWTTWKHGEVVLDGKGTVLVDDIPLRTPGRPRVAASCVAASDDGELLATGMDDGRVVVRDGISNTPVFEATAHRVRVTCARFIPSSHRLVTGGADGHLATWDVDSRTPSERTQAHPGFVGCLAASADGTTLATSGPDGAIRIWNADGLEEIVTLNGHTRAVGALAFHPVDRTLASHSWDQTVRLWRYDSSGGRLLALLHVPVRGEAIPLHYLRRSGLLVTAGTDGGLTIWNAGRSDDTPRSWRSLRLHDARLVAFENDQLIVGGATPVALPIDGSPARRLGADPDRPTAPADAKDSGPSAEVRTGSEDREWSAVAGPEGRIVLTHRPDDIEIRLDTGRRATVVDLLISGGTLFALDADGVPHMFELPGPLPPATVDELDRLVATRLGIPASMRRDGDAR